MKLYLLRDFQLNTLHEKLILLYTLKELDIVFKIQFSKQFLKIHKLIDCMTHFVYLFHVHEWGLEEFDPFFNFIINF